jgi:hypothetical protein
MSVGKWVWVALAATALLVLIAVGLIGSGVYFVSHQVQSGPSTPAEAQLEFDRVRAQYAGRPSLIELTGEESEAIVHREAVSDSPVDLEALDLLAWSPEHHRLVRISVPFWLIRLSPGRLNISGAEVPDFRHMNITAADLERFGRGVILDFEPPGGGHVLAVTR